MEKIRLNELNKALRQCDIGLDFDEIENTPAFGVYHVHNWDHGYDGFYGIKVYEDGSYDYGNAGFHGPRRQFYKDMQETINFLLEYLNFKNIQELIIAPCYRYSPFSSDDVEHNDIYEEIYAFLRKNNVRKNERSGIKTNIEDDTGPLEMYSGPPVKDQKGGKKSLGQGSRKEDFFIHHEGRCLSRQGRMRPLLVIKPEPPPQSLQQFGHILILVQVDALVLQASP